MQLKPKALAREVAMIQVSRNRVAKMLVILFFAGSCVAQSWVDLYISGAQTLAVHPDTSSILYIGTLSSAAASESTLLMSRDYGETHDTIYQELSIADIKFHPFSTDTLFLAVASSFGMRSGVLKVTREGVTHDSTWVDQGIQLEPNVSVSRLAIHRTNPDIMLAGTAAFGGGRLWRTTNGGNQWTVADPDHHADVGFLCRHPFIDDRFYYSTYAQTLFESQDGGGYWSPLFASEDWSVYPSCLAIHPEEEGFYFLGTHYGGLFQSADGGENWSPTAPDICIEHIFELLIDPSNPDQIFTISDLGIFHSLDGGLSWQNINFELETDDTRILVLDHASQLLYTGQRRASLYRLDLNLLGTEPSVYQPSHFNIDIFPNPMNPTTTIKYTLPAQGSPSVTIHDLQGRLVWSKSYGSQSAGEHRIQWSGNTINGHNAPSGIYIVQLTSGQRSETSKIVVLK